MSRWRIWLRSGIGEGPSQELVAASCGLSGGDLRRGKRLVRRGQAAEEVPIARYAVALARERQRRRASVVSLRVAIAGCALFVVAGVALAAFALAQSRDTPMVLSGGVCAIFFAYCAWRGLWDKRNTPMAEELNREFLRRLGAPYVPGGPAIAAPVPALVVACSVVLHVAFAGAVGGLFSLLANGQSLSSGHALTDGISGAIAAAIAAVITAALTRTKRQPGERSRPEYQHLRDLD